LKKDALTKEVFFFCKGKRVAVVIRDSAWEAVLPVLTVVAEATPENPMEILFRA
jgi:hypothetical protein